MNRDDPPGPRSRSQVRRLEATGALAPDEAWREMVRLGQELDADLCWAWWESATHRGHHRCAQRDGHTGLHRCCCGEETPFGNRPAAHRHERGTPCVDGCPGTGQG